MLVISISPFYAPRKNLGGEYSRPNPLTKFNESSYLKSLEQYVNTRDGIDQLF